jgi:hypothetical protein
MSEKLHPDRHILLYAKGHYRREPEKMFQELGVLVGSLVGVPPMLLSAHDILCVVFRITFPHITQANNPEWELRSLLENLITVTRREGRPLTAEDVVKRLLAILARAKIRDGETILINLGEPDYSLLPPP